VPVSLIACAAVVVAAAVTSHPKLRKKERTSDFTVKSVSVLTGTFFAFQLLMVAAAKRAIIAFTDSWRHQPSNQQQQQSTTAAR